MDSLFENSYIRSKEIAKEFYRYVCFKRPFILTFDILMGLSFFTNIILLIVADTRAYSVFALVPIFCLFQIFQYQISVKTMTKRDNEMSNGMPITIDMVVSNDEMTCTASNGSVTQISFNKIRKVIQTKKLILLRSEAKLIYIFPKDSFIKGSSDEFMSFLKQKGF